MSRKNTPRMVPLLSYVRRKGRVHRSDFASDEDSPVYDMDASQLRLLLQRLVDNEFLSLDSKGYYTRKE